MPNLFSASDRAAIARRVAETYDVDYTAAVRMVLDVLVRQGDSEHAPRVTPFLWAQLGPAMERRRRAGADGARAVVAAAREAARSQWAGAVFRDHPDLARMDRELEEFYGDA